MRIIQAKRGWCAAVRCKCRLSWLVPAVEGLLVLEVLMVFWKYEIGYMLGMVLPLLYFSERLTLLGRQVAGLHLSILVS